MMGTRLLRAQDAADASSVETDLPSSLLWRIGALCFLLNPRNLLRKPLLNGLKGGLFFDQLWIYGLSLILQVVFFLSFFLSILFR
jgi:hypothetical protein